MPSSTPLRWPWPMRCHMPVLKNKSRNKPKFNVYIQRKKILFQQIRCRLFISLVRLNYLRFSNRTANDNNNDALTSLIRFKLRSIPLNHLSPHLLTMKPSIFNCLNTIAGCNNGTVKQIKTSKKKKNIRPRLQPKFERISNDYLLANLWG